MTMTQYFKDAGIADDPYWTPCAKGDPGAVLFYSEEIVPTLAREIHRDQHGPSAWRNLTEAGQLHYFERTKRTLERAAQKE